MTMIKLNSLEQYLSNYKRSIRNPECFWEDIAESLVEKKWDKVLDWNFDEPKVKWFSGGQLNITENCLDRHLDRLVIKLLFTGCQIVKAIRKKDYLQRLTH